MISGCCVSHDWQGATCTAPKTCAKCGEPKEFTVEDANQRFVQAIDVYQKNWINFTDEQMKDTEYIIRNEIILCLLNNVTQTTNINSIESFDIKTKDGVELFHKLDENDMKGSKITDYQYFLRPQLFSLLMSEACNRWTYRF